MVDREDHLYLSIYILTIIIAMITGFAFGLPHIQFFVDDSYYYFGIAQNLADFGESSFGQINPTNGYHPLWLLLLAGLKALVPVLPTTTLAAILSGAASLVTCGLIWLAAARARLEPLLLPVLGVGLVFWLTPLLPGAYKLTFNGMETTLLVPLLLAVPCLLAGTPLRELHRLRTRRLIGVSLVLALVCLARLDAAAIVAAFVVAVALTNGTDRRTILALGTAPIVVVTIYAVINQVIFGTIVPVSSLAKSQAPMELHFHPFLQLFWWDAPQRIPTILGASIAVPMTVLLLQFLVVARQGDWTWYWRDIWTVFAIVCVLGTLAIFFVFSVNSNWRVWEWYKYGNMLATLAAVLGLSRQIRNATFVAPVAGVFRRRSVRGGVHAMLGIALFGLQLAYAWEKATEPLSDRPFTLESREVASRLNARHANKTLAVGNGGGALGYFYNGRVLHLEGLVEDPDFLRDIRHMTAPALANAYDVDMLARLGTPRQETARSVCFCEPKRPPFVCYAVDRDRQILSSSRFTVWMVANGGIAAATNACRGG